MKSQKLWKFGPRHPREASFKVFKFWLSKFFNVYILFLLKWPKSNISFFSFETSIVEIKHICCQKTKLKKNWREKIHLFENFETLKTKRFFLKVNAVVIIFSLRPCLLKISWEFPEIFDFEDSLGSGYMEKFFFSQ